jgi:iron complex transport system ATP-binding protein
VALLRQAPEVAFALPVLEVVLHGRWAHLSGLRFPGERDVVAARAALRRVGLAGFEARDLATLSAGERQRALLAKALVQESPLLLLDEPTSSLDIRHRVELHDLLGGLPESAGLLLVTHDLDLAAALCERAVLLAGGTVVVAGPLEEVFRAGPLALAFGHDACVEAHPDTGRPRVVPRFGTPNRRKTGHREPK